MIQRLTEENFKRYGIYIKSPKYEATDKGVHHEYWHNVYMDYFKDNKLTLGFLKIHKQDFCISELESHHQFSETFITVKGKGILTVATEEDLKDTSNVEEALSYFILEPGEAVILKKDIWHKPPIPLIDTIDLLMVLPQSILTDINLFKFKKTVKLELASDI